MNYAGYDIRLVKTNTSLPEKYIGSYKATPNQRMDVGFYRDMNQVLQRNVSDHTATAFEWSTPVLFIGDWEEFMKLLRDNYSVELERKIEAEYYDYEYCQYRSMR